MHCSNYKVWIKTQKCAVVNTVLEVNERCAILNFLFGFVTSTARSSTGKTKNVCVVHVYKKIIYI